MPRLMLLLALLMTLAVGAGCATSSLGRTQLKLMSPAQMDAMGVAAFAQLKSDLKPMGQGRSSRYVSCVATAVTAGLGDRSAWEVVVFDEKSANAFALPGRKIGVHTGLLDIAVTQDQLASVIGHEIAHVLEGHANERASAAGLSQVTAGAVGLSISSMEPGTQTLVMVALGATSQLGQLKYSRTHEREADLVGLDLMARAGFDPRASVTLWRNMAAAGRQAPLEFLSTHPSHATRIADLQARIPLALTLMKQARATGQRPACAR